MKFLIQRVSSANVAVDSNIIGEIEKGFIVFIGIKDEDSRIIADKMIQKLLNLRIFEDNNGKTNLSILDVNGSFLLISQFTLYASCKKGNRPSFTEAGSPLKAEEIYNYIIESCRDKDMLVQTGKFGADMKVSLVNEGPFTILLDSDEIFA